MRLSNRNLLHSEMACNCLMVNVGHDEKIKADLRDYRRVRAVGLSEHVPFTREWTRTHLTQKNASVRSHTQPVLLLEERLEVPFRHRIRPKPIATCAPS